MESQTVDGRFKSKKDFVDKNPLSEILKPNRYYAFVPKWIVGVSVFAAAIVATILIAAVVVVYNAPRPALYGENCDGRSCVSGAGLKCVNKTCQCLSNQYYAIKCNDKKSYNQSCSSTVPCKTNTSLLCRDGVCKCLNTQYWSNGTCTAKKTYKIACTKDEECLDQLMLYCENKTKTCNCSSSRYWDGEECTLKLTINETCNSTENCLTSQDLVCLSGKCNCVSTQYWDSKYVRCLNKLYENNSCAASYQCYSPMTCNVSNCRCGAFQYHNMASLTCINQKTINNTCQIDYNCRVDYGLSCQSGYCKCVSDTPYWSVFHNKCILQKTYGETTCYDVTDCVLGISLICNFAATQCNCPTSTVASMCDCTRASGNEWYWNGTSCTPALYNGSACADANNYMCQTLTQGTICNSSSGAFICECPKYKFFDVWSSSTPYCQNQQSYSGTCQATIGCRIDKGLYCNSGSCKCNTTYQFWDSSLLACVNYRNYSESCTATSECNTALGLLCNSGTACNCPLALGNNKCDCKRVSGSEYYWNGTMCVLASAFEQSCVAFTNYTCQTITEETYCNSSGVCSCGLNGALKPSNGKCAVCHPSWKLILTSSTELCFRISASKSASDTSATSSGIKSACMASDLAAADQGSVKLAKLSDSVVKSWFQTKWTSSETYYIDGKRNSVYSTTMSYGSSDGSWQIVNTCCGYYCSSTCPLGPWCSTKTDEDCVHYNPSSDCYMDCDCTTTQRYLFCQYTP